MENDLSLERFVPGRLLADLLRVSAVGAAAPRGSLRTLGQRRPITVLLADLAGFTAMAEQLDPERSVALLSRFFRAVTAACTPWGGEIEKFLGDACQVIFVDEPGLESAPNRAVRVALEVQQAVAAIGSGVDLRCTCAIESGEAVVALLAGGSRAEVTVIGEIVGAVDRLQKRADPGAIVVGPEAAAAIGPAALGVVLEPFGEEGALVRAAASLRFDEPGFFGRSEAIRLLEDLLDGLAAGTGSTLLVAGRPGAGKSALLEVLRRRADGRQIPVVRRLPAGRAPGAFLRSLFLAAGRDSRALLATPDGEALPEEVAEAFAALARRAPFVAIVDDLQEIDAPSRTVLARALPLVRARGGLVAVATLDAADGPRCDRAVELGPLAPFDAKRLLAGIVPERAQDHPWLEERVRLVGRLPGALIDAFGRDPVGGGRLEAMPAAERRLLDALAVLAPIAAPAVARLVDGWGLDLDAEAILSRLAEAGWIDLGSPPTVRIASPAVAELLRKGIAPETAERLRGEAVEAFRGLGWEDEAIALEAGGGARRRVEPRIALVERLLAFGCEAEAEAILRSALDAAAPAERPRLHLLEARILQRQGRIDDAATALLAAHGAASRPREQVEAALALAALVRGRGHVALARDCIARARAAAGDDPELRALVAAAAGEA